MTSTSCDERGNGWHHGKSIQTFLLVLIFIGIKISRKFVVLLDKNLHKRQKSKKSLTTF